LRRNVEVAAFFSCTKIKSLPPKTRGYFLKKKKQLVKTKNF